MKKPQKKINYLFNIMKNILCIALLLLVACTYNISMVDTHGEASDVIDSNQRADADVKPNLNIPAI